jgi:hypothetical protein
MAAARACACCGDVFAPRKDASSYCTKPECRRERERVLKAGQRHLEPIDVLRTRCYDAIAALRKSGDLDGEAALEYLTLAAVDPHELRRVLEERIVEQDERHARRAA